MRYDTNREINSITAKKDGIPQTYREAKQSRDCDDWIEAADKEMLAVTSNETWILVPRPKGRKVIPLRWVFALKEDAATFLKKFKARLVVKGFHLIENLDYDPNEISSTVIKLRSLRIVLAIVVKGGYLLRQMDAISAFTQSDLKEEIYVEQPEGYEDGTGRVCLLKKSLYGLKQASWNWREGVAEFMKSLGFKTCLMDENVFYKTSKTSHVIIMCLYVDDTITAYHPNDKIEVEEMINKIKNKFKV